MVGHVTMGGVIERIGQWLKEAKAWYMGNELPDYDLPDPDMSAYDHGLGTLRVDGEPKGYLASVRLQMDFPGR